MKIRYLIDEVAYDENGLIISMKHKGELVRCKDCKWFNNTGCAICIVDDTDRPSENSYCSFAERKEE